MNINRNDIGNPDWNISGLFIHDGFWVTFLRRLKENDIDLPFQYIYGTPPGLKVGGGRLSAEHFENKESSFNTLQEYINIGIGCRLALSNHLLEEKDFEEKQLNYLLMFLNDYPNNGVIISDDRFNEYIKTNYPNLQRICSVIRPAIEIGWGNDTADYYDKLSEHYDLVVVNCGFAKDLDKINQLKHKNKIEVLVNTRCTLNCKLAKIHYDIVAEGYLDKREDEEKTIELDAKERVLFEKCNSIKSKDILSGANFTVDELQTLLDNGISHFKLEGRDWPLEVIASDVSYYICDKFLFSRVCRNIMGVAI